MTCWNRLLTAGTPLAVLLAGHSVYAQAVTADDVISTKDGEIVVTAKPDPAPQVSLARAQARQITDASNIYDEPLPLFQDKVCPGVSGLPRELSEYIADRIRFNAKRARLRLGKAGQCTPNLLVAFVLDGRRALTEFDQKGNTILVDLPALERKDMLAAPGPVHVFIVAQHRSRDGMRPGFDQNQRYEIVHEQSANSLFLLPSRSDIQMSVVVIDIPAIDGMSAKQIADYATMRGLAKTRPVSGDPSYGTILSLFDRAEGHPAELTMFDLGYLKSIYSNSPNLAAAAKISGVKYQMRKLKQGEAVQPDD